MADLFELRKALTSAGDGEALVPPDLDRILHDELLKLQPLATLLPVQQANGKTHEYSIRSSHPQAWFEGETTAGDQANSVYQRKTVALKIQRIWGGVTGFAQTVDEAFVDALLTELEGSLEGMSNVMEYGVMWGTADDIGYTGDAYQYSGIIPRIFAYAPANVIDAGGDKITLADLDAALAKVGAHRQSRADPKLWAMGLQMKQVVDGLQTKVQLPLTQAELADGQIVMAAYGKAPIYETDFLVPEAVTTSPAVTGAQGGNDEGTLPAGTYTYRLSSVTMYGEQLPGTASSGVVADATHLHIDLSWTADSAAKLYMIWRQLASGGYFLLDIIPSKTYDASGKVNGNKTTYTDLGRTTNASVKPLASGEQNILIANTHERRGASFVGKIDEMGRPVSNLVSYVELSRVKDTYDYLLKTYHALKVAYPNLNAIIRHAKLA